MSSIICAKVCWRWRWMGETLAGARTSPRRGRPRPRFFAGTGGICAAGASSVIRDDWAAGIGVAAARLHWAGRSRASVAVASRLRCPISSALGSAAAEADQEAKVSMASPAADRVNRALVVDFGTSWPGWLLQFARGHSVATGGGRQPTQTCPSSSFKAAIRRNNRGGGSCRSLRQGDVGA